MHWEKILEEQRKNAPPPKPRMTEEEFCQQKADLVDGLPIEFAGWLDYEAWERGHSAGYEEIIGILQGLTYGFRKAFKEWQERTGVK
jgi:hypothetical protein